MNSLNYKNIRYTLSLLPIILLLILLPQCKSANTEKIVTEFKSILAFIEDYEYGLSHAWMEDFQNIMVKVYNNPETYEEIESSIIDALKADISPAAKQIICSYFGPIASAYAVPVLKDMLMDEELSAMALTAIQSIPDQAVDQALMEALPATEGLTKAGIINVLALRKYPLASDAIAGLISDPDPVIRRSAVDALGRIGTTEAAESLKQAFEKSDPPLKWDISDAWLLYADNILPADPENALTVYSNIYDSRPPSSLLYAALKGIFKCDEIKGGSLIYSMLTGTDPELQTLVMPLVRDLDPDTDMRVYLDILPHLEEYQQMQLFTVLADRENVDVKDIIKEAVNHSNPDIRLAALMALRNIAGASDVEFLASVAAQARGREQDMARECLEIIKGPDIDNTIIKGLDNPDPKIRVEFIRSIGERNLVAGISPVLETLKDSDRRVKLESYKVLGKLAGPDQLMSILQASMDAGSSAERNEAERTITLVSLKIPEEDQRVDDILAILPEVTNSESVVMLIQAMGNIGCEKALPVIRDYLNNENLDIQIASIKALSVWPDATPLDDLRQIVESSEDIKAHNLAMNGYIRMIRIDDTMNDDQKTDSFRHAYELAKNLDEKRIVVSGLSGIRSKGAFQMAIGLLDNPELKSEAEAAISSIAGPLGDAQPEFTRAELNKLIESTDNPAFKERLQEILEWMD